MLSVDTNILVHAVNSGSPDHDWANAFIASHLANQEFAISEYVLTEMYVLLRNPVVMPKPLSAPDAVNLIMQFRLNKSWTLLKTTSDNSESIWKEAAKPQFPRRAIFDARLAYSLAAQGVKRFATRNIADFQRFGLFEVFDPIQT